MKERFRFVYIGKTVSSDLSYGDLHDAANVYDYLRMDVPLSKFIELNNDEVERYNELWDKFKEEVGEDPHNHNKEFFENAFEKSELRYYVSTMASKYGRG